MPSINGVFIRLLAGIISVAIVKLEIVDQGQQDTITDIITMLITGGAFLLFAAYEFYHIFLQKDKPLSPKELKIVDAIKGLLGRLFVVQSKKEDPLAPQQ